MTWPSYSPETPNLGQNRLERKNGKKKEKKGRKKERKKERKKCSKSCLVAAKTNENGCDSDRNSWFSNSYMWPLQSCHNERYDVSNHRRLDCLLTCLFRRRSQKISKLRVIGLCEGNPPVTGEVPAQRVSNAEKISIWWRHHEMAREPGFNDGCSSSVDSS